jgi:protoheme IX farnesyltransferase
MATTPTQAPVPGDARTLPAPGLLRDLAALTKPRITFFVVVTTAGGLWLAPGEVSPMVALWAILGTALVVSSANALNCWMERDVDRHMARTKNRPLPAGRMTPEIALTFGLALGAISVPMLAVLVNPLTALLAAIALLSYVWVYTPMKQRTPKALLIGSIPGAMPPLMGWSAATGNLEAPGLVLFGILFLWQLPHFLAISVFRQNEYAKAGIKVLPSVRGNAVTKLHAIAYAGALVPMSLLLVPLGIVGNLYLVVIGIAGVVFAAMCVMGLRSTENDNRWARGVFIASLVYLPLLFAALAVDVAT